MAAPKLSDFTTWIGKKFTRSDWDNNLQAIINFLTTNYDLTVGSINATTITGDISGTTGLSSASVTMVAGENIAEGKCVTITTSEAFVADGTSAAGAINYIGVASETKTTGEDIVIYVFTAPAFTGLAIGTMYYIDASGDLTAVATNKKAGVAVTATTLLIESPFYGNNSNTVEADEVRSNNYTVKSGEKFVMFDFSYWALAVASIGTGGATNTWDFNWPDNTGISYEVIVEGNHSGATRQGVGYWIGSNTIASTNFFGQQPTLIREIGSNIGGVEVSASSSSANVFRLTVTNNDATHSFDAVAVRVKFYNTSVTRV